jgi:leader peptidase (prepilin peptidase) / N-methyltransferase
VSRDRGSYVALAVAAVLVALVFVRFGFTGHAVVDAFFVTVLVVLSRIDIRERRLPNNIVLPSTVVVLAAQIALEPDRWYEWLLASLGAGLFLLVPLLVYPAGMGMGDVKLALLLGAALGWDVVAALVLGLLSSFVVAIGLIVLKGSSARKTYFPFGPFLALGGIAALFLDGS